MITDNLSYTILAKARAMYGKRLKPENYKDLLQKHSVSEVAAYLKNETSYSKALSGIQENLIHRGQLENLIRRDTLMKFLRLSRYDSSRDNGFYHYYMLNIEAEQILACLRLLNSGLLESYIETLPGYLLNYITFDIIKLAHANNFDEVLESLRKTEYYEVLLPCKPQRGELPDIFECEYRLRQHFYDKAFLLIKGRYHGEQRRQLTELFVSQMELANITSIYRLKHFFRADAQTIESRILKTHNAKIDREMAELIKAQDTKEMLALLDRKRKNNFYAADDFEFIEHANQQTRLSVNKRYLYFSRYPSVVFAAYMLLCRIEIENITTIIEGIRYNMPPAEIEKLLVIQV
ncbi:V-type ATPase subunit [Acetanaerobacterium elongatum]|uniref:V/A-type H+-transporting ATPase subunit C n=1 Tax=Acetanaerobacterium elongatum TaxID=258515 RepID=A0A1G9ZW00_9FIRM|nr:V-type ATPase subunit [Acetanaerobacterium elongatum]SDN25408.1 V/A-type H+-transporting ATPase subunit C [Acetanaerobacterium elongatum]